MDRIPRPLFKLIERLIPLPVVSLLVKRPTGEYLLVRRNIKPLKGYWLFPGGRINRGEDISQAAYRELAEEVHLHPGHVAVVGATSLHLPERDTVEAVCLVTLPLGDIQLNEESSEYGWFLPDALPLPMHPMTLEQMRMSEAFLNGVV